MARVCLRNGDLRKALSLRKKHFYSRLVTHLEATDYEATAELLRRYGFNLNVKIYGNTYPFECMTPLVLAIKKGRVDLIRLLVRHGARVNWMRHRITRACGEGNVEVVKCLLELGVDMDSLRKSPSPLMMATRRERPELLSWMLEQGFAVDARCSRNYRPLWKALRVRGNRISSMVAILLRHGAPVGTCSGGRSTRSTLHGAVQHRNKDYVVLAMECGAKPSSVVWSRVDRDRDPSFFAWYERYVSRPLSLKCLSGQVVRRRLVETCKKSILPYLTQLKLPSTLVEYLAMDRFKYMERAS